MEVSAVLITPAPFWLSPSAGSKSSDFLRLVSVPLSRSTRWSNGRSQGTRFGVSVRATARTEAADSTAVASADAITRAREDLLDAINGVGGRGRKASEKQKQIIAEAVKVLETAGGVSEATGSELIEGRWQLMYTTRPGTASPIQRTFVGVDAFTVFQEITLRGTDDPRVINTVDFGERLGELRVEAEASIGGPQRINFRFDRAAFFVPFWPRKFPYPVPFRLLGDKAKGWLDTTYLAPQGNLRISKGNKGTTFVLQKNPGPKQRLMLALRSGRNIPQVLDEVVALNPNPKAADSPTLEGKWRLIWSSQASDANRLQQLTAGIASNWQIINRKAGRLENLVEFFPGLRLRAGADTSTVSDSRTDVQIDGASLEIGPLKIPLGVKGEGWIEQLYLDEKLRISRGNKGSTFVHVRDD